MNPGCSAWLQTHRNAGLFSGLDVPWTARSEKTPFHRFAVEQNRHVNQERSEEVLADDRESNCKCWYCYPYFNVLSGSIFFFFTSLHMLILNVAQFELNKTSLPRQLTLNCQVGIQQTTRRPCLQNGNTFLSQEEEKKKSLFSLL